MPLRPHNAADRVTVTRRGTSTPPSAPTSTDPAAIKTIRFRVSSDDVDELGDIVVQQGLEWPAEVPAVVDHARALTASVGAWRDIEQGAHETFATLHLLPYGVSPTADLVRHLHAGGWPLASSVSFDLAFSDISPRLDARGRQVGNIYRRGDVREVTLTQFPANPAAVAVARSLGFSPDELTALSRTPASTSTHRGQTPGGAAPTPRGSTMTLAEQIAAAQAAHDAAQATLTTAIEANDNTDAAVTAIQRATAECDALMQRLTVLRAAQAAAAANATGVGNTSAANTSATTTTTTTTAAGGRDPRSAGAAGDAAAQAIARMQGVHRQHGGAGQGSDVPAGTLLARLVIARSIAHESREPVTAVIERMFPSDRGLIAVGRTAVGVADTTTAGWAAELVRSETRAMMSTELLPISIWAALANASGLTIPFNGANSVVVPSMNVGQAVGGAWVGEGGHIPLVKGTTSAKRLNRFKIGGIVPITKELERTSDPAAVEVMRRFLRQVLANLLDTSLVNANAEVAGIRPAGLLNGVVAIPGEAGGGDNAFTQDIQAVLAAFKAANIRGRIALLMSEMAVVRLSMLKNALGQLVYPEASSGRLGPFVLIGSPFVADATLIAVALDHFASAFDPLESDVNDTATLVAANADATAPTHAGTGAFGGAIGTALQVPPDGGIPVSGGSGASVAGAVALSLWQTWSLGIRMVMPASFGVTQAGAVQEVTGITW